MQHPRQAHTATDQSSSPKKLILLGSKWTDMDGNFTQKP
jgi:hypothetical protein